MNIFELMQLIVIFAIYLFGVHIARYFWIVIPTHELLEAQIDSVSSRIMIEHKRSGETTDKEKVIIQAISGLLDKAKERSNKIKDKEHSLWERIKCRIKCFICEDYLPAWRLVHEAERQAVDLMPLEQVQVRLRTARDELNEKKDPHIKKLAGRIDHELKEEGTKVEAKECLKALLKEALRIIYDDRDNEYCVLATFHSKALWLISATIGLIILLSITVGNEVLFLAGGVGGLLSLIRKITKVPRLPTDYGAYWTTLFYSPLLGALVGWAGVFLVALLVKANIIGSLFRISWDGLDINLTPEVIGFAILFGYSVGVYERLTEKLESAAGVSAHI